MGALDRKEFLGKLERQTSLTGKDLVAWMWLRKVDWRSLEQDLKLWKKLRGEKNPETCLISNPLAAMDVIEQFYPGSTVRISKIGESVHIQMELLHPSGISVKASAVNLTKPQGLGETLMEAFSLGRERFDDLQKRIDDLGFDIGNIVRPADWDCTDSGWRLEKCGDYFRIIHPDLRLASTGFGKREAMIDMARDLRWNTSIAMKMRDRFENLLENGEICNERDLAEGPAP